MRISRAGSRNRVPAGRVPAKLQAPGIGCLQACRHPAGTRQAPSRHPGSGAGCLQAPAATQQAPGIGCRVPAGTRQAPSRHPGSGTGCLQPPGRHPAGTRNRGPAGLQAPCRHPAGIHQAPGVGCLVQGACRVPAGACRVLAGCLQGACRVPDSMQAPCRRQGPGGDGADGEGLAERGRQRVLKSEGRESGGLTLSSAACLESFFRSASFSPAPDRLRGWLCPPSRV